MRAAPAAIEIDVSGPDSADAVLFFIFKTKSAAPAAIGEQQDYLGLQHASQKLGIVPGYPPASDGTRRSLIWDQAGQDVAGDPTEVTVAAVAVGQVVVEGVAAQPGTTTSATSAAALAKWGVAHLARAERTR